MSISVASRRQLVDLRRSATGDAAKIDICDGGGGEERHRAPAPRRRRSRRLPRRLRRRGPGGMVDRRRNRGRIPTRIDHSALLFRRGSTTARPATRRRIARGPHGACAWSTPKARRGSLVRRSPDVPPRRPAVPPTSRLPRCTARRPVVLPRRPALPRHPRHIDVPRHPRRRRRRGPGGMVDRRRNQAPIPTRIDHRARPFRRGSTTAHAHFTRIDHCATPRHPDVCPRSRRLVSARYCHGTDRSTRSEE